ncbi:MAG: leucine--tRNA ligase [Halobacteriales archaeon]
MDYEPAAIEEKWQARWREAGRYEADPADEGDPTFVTVPYPYPSGGMHIGHARTYTVPDVWARYRRLQGDNVLFPIAWHVTGTPIVGAVERLKKGEEDQIETLKEAFNVPDSDLESLETPMGYARYFIEEAESSYKRGLRQLGLSVDWRREFTTNDDRYSKFITWQYETLHDRGLLEKGYHPVRFCTNERQPVTDHDLLEGEGAEFQEYTLVRFEHDGGVADPADEPVIVPMATLRPETVHGVTNAFVHPDAEYVIADVDGERWLVSREAAEKFGLQRRDVEVLETVSGAAIVGEDVTNPVTGDSLLVLPATFVDPDNATGVVMSVPAHSPDDWVALESIKADPDRLREYGIDPDAVAAIEPVAILEIEGYGEFPAADIVDKYDVEAQGDPALEEATQELYNDEFREGRLKPMYGEYAGDTVQAARDAFRDDHRAAGRFDAMYEFSEEVICRCGGDVEVSEQETWFLRYNDPEWRAKAEDAVDGLDTIPEHTRDEYYHTIDWLNEWPCIRNYGLGTRLPWDDDFVIEPLSDSTIYMAYYTIAPRLKEIPVEDLDRAFFDALFFGPDAVEDPDERALELREEWAYWYPVDYRCSANDLISNHLTFFLYHHAELFEPDDWPGGITVMGMGLLEGESMSSSRGHVVLVDEAADRYGADTARFYLLNSSEPWQDFDWRAEQVTTVRNQLDRFWRRAQEVIEATDAPGATASDGGLPADPELERIDRWLQSKLQAAIHAATEALDGFETRTASQVAFYEIEEHLRWYRKRADLDRPGARHVLREVLEARLVMLAPFVPFLANELHEQLTGEPAEDAAWPQVDTTLERPDAEAEEELVRSLTDDVREVIDVTGEKPDVVRIYLAAEWKRVVYETVVETGPDVSAAMSAVMEDPAMQERGDAVADLVKELVEFVREHPAERVERLESVDEAAVYGDAADFLAREFDAKVELYAEGGDPVDPAGRAQQATPFRPAIHLE